jgi:flagellar hook-associated protein 2
MRGPSGESNAFTISVTEGTTPGLSALAYDPRTGATSNMTRNQTAGNAQANINGISISSESNSLSNVLDGLSLQLNKVTSSAVDVTVRQDQASIRSGVESFQKAYNDLVGLIRVQTLYDESSKTAGPLQGDSTATGLLRQLRGLVGSSSTASGVFNRLSAVGFDIRTDGTLAINSGKLSQSMDNLPELQKLFSADSTDPNAQGMARRFQALASQIVGADGVISSRQEGLRATIKRNGDKIERLEDRVALVEARLRKQYTALDNNMGNLNALQSYVTQQLSLLNKSG